MSNEVTKLLIVDDDAGLVSELTDELSQSGFSVASAHNGEEALLFIYGELPDIILLHMVLEDYTGYELWRLLQDYPETAGITIVLSSSTPDIHQSLAEKFNRDYMCLGRPIDRQQLGETLKKAMQAKKVHPPMTEDNSPDYPDRLAGVYDEDFLKKRMDEDVRKALKNHTTLSALKIEIACNQKSSQEGGQSVLHVIMHECAKVIRKSLRTIDLIARAGEKGFIALLPHMEKSSALAYGQRIKNTMAEHVFPDGIDVSSLHITIAVNHYDGKTVIDGQAFREGLEEAFEKAGG